MGRGELPHADDNNQAIQQLGLQGPKHCLHTSKGEHSAKKEEEWNRWTPLQAACSSDYTTAKCGSSRGTSNTSLNRLGSAPDPTSAKNLATSPKPKEAHYEQAAVVHEDWYPNSRGERRQSRQYRTEGRSVTVTGACHSKAV